MEKSSKAQLVGGFDSRTGNRNSPVPFEPCFYIVPSGRIIVPQDSIRHFKVLDYSKRRGRGSCNGKRPAYRPPELK